MFLYSVVSSPLDSSNLFTFHPLADLLIPTPTHPLADLLIPTPTHPLADLLIPTPTHPLADLLIPTPTHPLADLLIPTPTHPLADLLIPTPTQVLCEELGHATITTQTIHSHITIAVYNQALIYTADSTAASWIEQKAQALKQQQTYSNLGPFDQFYCRVTAL